MTILSKAAGDECKVWVLERSAFQDAMAEAAKRHKEEHVERLRGIPILDNIPDSTLEKIADLIRVVLSFVAMIVNQLITFLQSLVSAQTRTSMLQIQRLFQKDNLGKNCT